MYKRRQKTVGRHRGRGFEKTSGLLQDRIRKVGESRGFAVSRLLVHWAEIVGEETARVALPVKISYSQGGFGATLTILTTGSHAPMLQADLPKIREKVNICYGYSAISRIRITQTASSGFAEGKIAFEPAPKAKVVKHDARVTDAAQMATKDVLDDPLRRALEELGENILTKNNF